MGLSGWLAARAVSSAHVLVVEVPGWWRTRAAVERRLAERGWRTALSPADADVLLVCGHPGPELRDVLDRVVGPAPRPAARAAVDAPSGVDAALGAAAGELLDGPGQLADARDRSRTAADPTPADDRGDTDHGDVAPAGVPLADGGPDRDGLGLDVLHVPLGPVLPWWPAGLVLHCELQGDVVTGAAAHVLGAAAPPPEPAGTAGERAARRCDGAARVLAVAGWDDAATTAAGVRDALLAGAQAAPVARRLDRLASRVARSRTLRWQLRGLGPLERRDLAGRDLAGPGAAGAARR